MATATANKPCAVKPPVVKDQPLFIGGKFVDSAAFVLDHLQQDLDSVAGTGRDDLIEAFVVPLA
jgi:hypothetical protein